MLRDLRIPRVTLVVRVPTNTIRARSVLGFRSVRLGRL